MRTIRDNYYIITGHTYEEYCKKYHRGIGKGKLLSFTEEEAKYLKKNKHYWEVVGPDGKTLYCQVSKLKPKHIIIPLVVAVLAGGGTAAGILLPKYLNKNKFDGTVTDEEWKESFEYIVNVFKKNKLNYSTEGYMNIIDSDSTLTIKNLKADGNIEEANYENTSTNESGKVYLYQYKQVPLIWYGKGSGDAKATRTMLKDYVTQLYGQLYYQQSDFTFNKDNKSYDYKAEIIEEETYTLRNVDTSIKYSSDKKIQSISCKYELDKNFKYESVLSYTYGETKLEDWASDEEFKQAAKKVTYDLAENSSTNKWEVTNLPIDGTTFIATNDNTNTFTVDGINTIRLIDSVSSTPYTAWCKYDGIYVDGELLIRNQGFKYIFEGGKMVGMKIINRTLTHENKISLKTSLYGITSGNPQLVFSVEN